VRLEEERAVIRAPRNGEKLAADAAGRHNLSPPGRDHPLTPQRLKGRAGFADALRQLPGAGEHPLGFGRAQPFQRLDRRAEAQKQGQLVPIAVGTLGQPLDHVDDGLLPGFASDGVMGKELHLLPQPIGVELLNGGNDPGVKRAPSVLQKRAVGHLVREGMLERVLHVREEAGLVKEFSGLKLAQGAAQRIFFLVGHRLEQGERDVLPDD
jgi:hypothetical protein